MPDQGELWAAGGISLMFVSLIFVAELWRKFGNPKPEWTRKLVHFGGGGICLALPFVIESHWIVLAMAVGMVALFTAGRLTGTLGSLHAVERGGRGVEYYPVVIYLLFLLSARSTLEICDLRRGAGNCRRGRGTRREPLRPAEVRSRRQLQERRGFARLSPRDVRRGRGAAHVLDRHVRGDPRRDQLRAGRPAGGDARHDFRGGRTGRQRQPVGSARHVRGVNQDPAAGCGRDRDAECQLRVDSRRRGRVLVAVAGLQCRRHARVHAGCVCAWSLGSFVWALPVLLGLLVYTVAVYAARHEAFLKVRSVFKAIIPPVLVLLAANVAYQFDNRATYNFLYGPYLTGCVAVTIQSCWALLLVDWHPPLASRELAVLGVSALCMAILAVPQWLVVEGASLTAIGSMFATCAVVALLFDNVIQRASSDDNRWHFARFVLSTVAMLVTALFQALRWSPEWDVW